MLTSFSVVLNNRITILFKYISLFNTTVDLTTTILPLFYKHYKGEIKSKHNIIVNEIKKSGIQKVT